MPLLSAPMAFHRHYHAYMEVFSLCVCPSLFHDAVSYLIPRHKKAVKSYCPPPLPILTFTSYVCLASYITLFKFNSLCKMRHSQFLSHRTVEGLNKITCIMCLAQCLSPIFFLNSLSPIKQPKISYCLTEIIASLCPLNTK